VSHSGAVTSTYYYLRDAQGNEMCRYVKYTNTTSQLMYVAQEHSIYGSSRVGVDNRKDTLYMGAAYTTAWGGANTSRRALGLKSFELSNHLGNVLVTVSDKPVYKVSSATVYFQPEVTSISDFYPFGASIQGRSFSSTEYRFGFNGKEDDGQVNGEGNSIDFGARMLDTRLGRWLSVDREFKYQPDNTTYKVNFNNPNIFMDPDGRREFLTISYYEDGKLVKTETSTISDKYHYKQGIDGNGDKIDRYFDIYHSQSINSSSKNKTITIVNESSVLSQNYIEIVAPWGSEYGAELYRDFKDWSSVRGGIELTSEEGGFRKGRSSTINADKQLVNVDVLLTTLSSLGGVTVPKILEQSVLLKSIVEKGKEFYDKHIGPCTVQLCRNKLCPRSNADSVKQNPNINCKNSPGIPPEENWHSAGGESVEVECYKLEQNEK